MRAATRSFAQWKQDITDVAKFPNVVAKLGGMAMPDNDFD
jgi:L-fuconolactonase